MGKSLTHKQSSVEKDEVGRLAVDLLAYAAMGAEEALNQLTLSTPGIRLGQVMVIWYRMCEQAVGSEAAASTARRTAQAFHNSMVKITDADTKAVRNRGVAYSIARGLLIDLATGELDRFAELWESTMNYDVAIIVETVALMLGFTRGILDAMVAQ